MNSAQINYGDPMFQLTTVQGCTFFPAINDMHVCMQHYPKLVERLCCFRTEYQYEQTVFYFNVPEKPR